MGERLIIMNKFTFRSQFTIALILTLILSIICTVAVWGGSLKFLIHMTNVMSLSNKNIENFPEVFRVGFVILFVLGNMAAPFVFILLFTILFARRIGKRLVPPIVQLINGAGRIQRNELDFTLSVTGGSKELVQLTEAFEEMRSSLHQSLSAQWRMEQERRDMVAAIAHDLRTPLTDYTGTRGQFAGE